MNGWERLHRQAERYKQSYPPGTRVILLNMNDPYSPVESGMRGTVQSVDDIGQLLMKWDNGRALALIPGEDSFRRLTQEEIDRELQEQAQEQTSSSGTEPVRPFLPGKLLHLVFQYFFFMLRPPQSGFAFGNLLIQLFQLLIYHGSPPLGSSV